MPIGHQKPFRMRSSLWLSRWKHGDQAAAKWPFGAVSPLLKPLCKAGMAGFRFAP
jgi:hypothetical protein